MNSPGATMPRSGWSQRTSASTPARRPVFERDDRLVDEAQLAELDGALELRPELVALADRGVHARVEDREAGLAVGLGHVHRDVGVADDVRRDLGGVAGARDPDARGDRDVAGPPIRYGARSSRTSRSAIAIGALEVGRVLGQDRELVAAEAGHEVALADRPGDPLGDRDEQRVAGRVAERVVDDLEVVEVDEQDGGDRLAPWRGARATRGPARG